MNLNVMRRIGAFMMTIAMMLSLVAVSMAAPSDPAGDTVTITLKEGETAVSSPITMAVRDQRWLNAVVTVNGTVQSDATVTWSSSDKTAVNVTKSGRLDARKPAETVTITATYTHSDAKEYKATCTVTVPQPPIDVKFLTMRPDTDQIISVNSSLTFTADPRADDDITEATEKLVWTIEDASSSGVALLEDHQDKTCTVTAKKPGSFTVKVATEDKGHSAECRVNVSGIALDATSLRMLVGESKSLTLSGYGDAPAVSTAVWSSTNISVAEVIDGRIIGHYPGTATITVEVGSYTASCTVTVEEDVANVIDVSAEAGAAVSFSSLYTKLDRRSVEKTGANLSYINSLQVSPNQGVLYYGYLSSATPGAGVGGENYYVNPSSGQFDLDDISFVSNSDFSGTAVIYYTGRSTNGRSFNGAIHVRISADNDIYYSTSSDQPVYFEMEDFSAVCMAKTGKEIISISFVPPSVKKGVLHYNYSTGNVYNPEVEADIAFYRTKAPYLDDVVFVPEKDFVGTVSIPYYCTTSTGTYTGKVAIRVSEAQVTDESKISYHVTTGGQVDFEVDDFNRLCVNMTGSNLSYVYLNLPNAAAGTLYYNYNTQSNYGSLVSGATRYFRSNNPRISNITFVAGDTYAGTITVPFTGYSVNGEDFYGEVDIRIDGYSGVISYRSNYGENIHFNSADFNELSLNRNGRSINYVCFEQPASRCGTLYRGTTHNSNTKINNTMKFNRSSGSYQIDDVVFVPNSSYTGTFDLPFNGYDIGGKRISGVVQITVERQAGNVVVTYQTVSGGIVHFDAEQFDIACQLLTGERLNYVQFKQPPSGTGKLSYHYSSGSSTAVQTYVNYYRTNSSRLLEDVSFRAADSYNGKISMQYTGVSTAGKRYNGTLEIIVTKASGASVNYNACATPVQLNTADFESACVNTTGRKLAYIRFSDLPGTAEGKLYLNYTTPMKTGTAVKTGTNYYVDADPAISQITFVPKAGYQGVVLIPFIGVDMVGNNIIGTLRIDLSNQYCPNHFKDMTGYETAKPAVEFLYQCGVVKGYGDGTYGPGKNISRGEFTTMVYRAFELPDAKSSYSFPDVPTDSFYAQAVAAAKALGIVEGNGESFMPLSTITRQDAMTIVQRAMEATGRTVPNVSTSLLSAYSDGGQVADYARLPVSTMLYLGAVSMDQDHKIRPRAELTRAEMAILLYYILTQ